MFDQITETRIADGKAQVRTLFDEGDLAAMEFAEACEALVAAERSFEKIDRSAKAQLGIPDNLCAWFDSLEERYEAEKRLWNLFTAGDRSPRTGRMYLQFREALLAGGKVRADA